MQSYDGHEWNGVHLKNHLIIIHFATFRCRNIVRHRRNIILNGLQARFKITKVNSYNEGKSSRNLTVLRRRDTITSIMTITVENSNPIPRIAKANARSFNAMSRNFWLAFSFSLYLSFEIINLSCFFRTNSKILASKSRDVTVFNLSSTGQSSLIEYTPSTVLGLRVEINIRK